MAIKRIGSGAGDDRRISISETILARNSGSLTRRYSTSLYSCNKKKKTEKISKHSNKKENYMRTVEVPRQKSS